MTPRPLTSSNCVQNNEKALFWDQIRFKWCEALSFNFFLPGISGFWGSTRSDMLKRACASIIISTIANPTNLKRVKFKRTSQLFSILFSLFQLHGIHCNLVLKAKKDAAKNVQFSNSCYTSPQPLPKCILPSQTQK